MFLTGIAGAPLYVLGVAYLDESVKKKVAPIYIGFFGSSGTVGKLLGKVIGTLRSTTRPARRRALKQRHLSYKTKTKNNL